MCYSIFSVFLSVAKERLGKKGDPKGIRTLRRRKADISPSVERPPPRSSPTPERESRYLLFCVLSFICADTSSAPPNSLAIRSLKHGRSNNRACGRIVFKHIIRRQAYIIRRTPYIMFPEGIYHTRFARISLRSLLRPGCDR